MRNDRIKISFESSVKFLKKKEKIRSKFEFLLTSNNIGGEKENCERWKVVGTRKNCSNRKSKKVSVGFSSTMQQFGLLRSTISTKSRKKMDALLLSRRTTVGPFFNASGKFSSIGAERRIGQRSTKFLVEKIRLVDGKLQTLNKCSNRKTFSSGFSVSSRK